MSRDIGAEQLAAVDVEVGEMVEGDSVVVAGSLRVRRRHGAQFQLVTGITHHISLTRDEAVHVIAAARGFI